jgi:hypothetical protein
MGSGFDKAIYLTFTRRSYNYLLRNLTAHKLEILSSLFCVLLSNPFFLRYSVCPQYLSMSSSVILYCPASRSVLSHRQILTESYNTTDGQSASPVEFATFYCLRFETFLFVASCDSQGYGGSVRPRLHTGFDLSLSQSQFLYGWRFIANQFVLAPSPLRLTARIFFSQLNTCGHSPYIITSSLTRGCVCHIQLLLALASTFILGTRDYILLSQIREFPFCRLLRCVGLRWRYSTPPPHGCESLLVLQQSSDNPLKVAIGVPSRRHSVEQFIFFCCHANVFLVVARTVYLAVDW